MTAKTPTPAAAPRFQLAGWSDITVCECCGKVDLRRTMKLIDSDGFITHYGAMCGARALGVSKGATVAQMERAASAADEKRAAFYRAHWAQCAPIMPGDDRKRAIRDGITAREFAAWLAEGATFDRLRMFWEKGPATRPLA